MADRDLVPVINLVNRIGPALAQGDRRQLKDIIAQLIALRAPMGGQWEQLSGLAAEIGEIGLARQAIDLFAEASGGGAGGDYRKAALLFDLGFLREADALLRSIPAHLPDPVSHAYSRATAALNLGKPDEARVCLERVTLARPQLGSAWLLLAQTANLADESGLADRIVGAERLMRGAPPAEQAHYLYALGKVYADRSDHAAAFAAFARGAGLMKAMVTFDRTADRAEAGEAVRDYSAERISAVAREQRESTGRTIFVTGLPRSGTTLVEHILASHSGVSDGAELNLLSLLAKDVRGQSLAALAHYVQAEGVAPAARLWQHWLHERFPEPGRIVNKAIDTSRYLGLAAALLPEAPLVWITRDPLDRAWSCFRTHFLGNAVPWSYDLEDIAGHFRVEDQLLVQWQEILGDRLLVLSYEALVTDPAVEIRRLLAHCSLAEEPAVFAPHENRRAVATASMVQVRRPIHRDAIGAAAPYRHCLAPFIEAYSD